MDSRLIAFHGPSHVVRMGYAVQTGQVPGDPDARYFGGGGVPVWTPRTVASGQIPDRANRVLVGDFRFGNRVAALPDPFAPDAPRRFTLIAPELISPENDRIVFKLAIDALDGMANRPNADLRILFWDLLIRESRNRTAGNYVTDGHYIHPIWNLEEVTARYRNFAPDLSGLVGTPAAESLAVDANCHPSLKGWSFIFNALGGLDGPELLKQIDGLDAVLREKLFYSSPEAILIGSSQVVQRLERLWRTGAVVFPKGWQVDPEMSAEEALNTGKLVVDFHPLAYSPKRGLKSYRGRVAELGDRVYHLGRHSNYRVVLWDLFAWNVIGTRASAFANMTPDQPEFGSIGLERQYGSLMAPLGSLPPALADAMIELNRNMEPTQLGMMVLASLVTFGRVGPGDVARYRELIAPFFPASRDAPSLETQPA